MTAAEATKLFAYEHLPPHLREVSEPFYILAGELFNSVPDHMAAYRTKALEELWNAKNWSVAAVAQAED